MVEVRRGDGVVEAVHRVHAVAVRDGTVVAESGDGGLVCFMRSSSKPIQALPLARRALATAEAAGLARAIDLNVVQEGLVTITAIRPATYIGKGKVDEFAGLVKSLQASVVVMDCPVSPVQNFSLRRVRSPRKAS